MLIQAKYDNEKVLLNTDYVVDVWNFDKPVVSCYVLDEQRGEYKVEQTEFQKWLDYANKPQKIIICQ